MERYKVTLTGGPTSMLMHADDVAKADELKAYRGAAKGKKKGGKSVAGDDRTPPWSYWTYINDSEGQVCLTDLQLSSCLMKGATEFKLPGKTRTTLKAASQTLMRVVEPAWPIEVLNGGKKPRPISLDSLHSVGKDATFDEHQAHCLRLGIILDVSRATVGTSKHVRVRPKFAPGWVSSGEIQLLDESIISGDILAGILEYCGDFVGLGDWRPSSPKKPGPHGRFTAQLKRIG